MPGSSSPDPGQRPLGLGIGLATLLLLLALPWILVPAWYLFANVVAIATGRDFSSDTVSVPALLVGLVAIVTVLVLATALLAGILGRSLSPKRRDASA
ncbi:MAG: hypothetical protein ACKO8G_06440 [Actinomycetota bacterium]